MTEIRLGFGCGCLRFRTRTVERGWPGYLLANIAPSPPPGAICFLKLVDTWTPTALQGGVIVTNLPAPRVKTTTWSADPASWGYREETLSNPNNINERASFLAGPASPPAGAPGDYVYTRVASADSLPYTLVSYTPGPTYNVTSIIQNYGASCVWAPLPFNPNLNVTVTYRLTLEFSRAAFAALLDADLAAEECFTTFVGPPYGLGSRNSAVNLCQTQEYVERLNQFDLPNTSNDNQAYAKRDTEGPAPMARKTTIFTPGQHSKVESVAPVGCENFEVKCGDAYELLPRPGMENSFVRWRANQVCPP